MMLNPGISLEKATCVSYAKKLAIKFHFMISVCVLVRWHVNLLRQFMRKSRDSCSTLRGTKRRTRARRSHRIPCSPVIVCHILLPFLQSVHKQNTNKSTCFADDDALHINILLMVQLLKYYDPKKNLTTFSMRRGGDGYLKNHFRIFCRLF